MKFTKIPIYCVLFFTSISILSAQKSTNTAGGEASGSSGTVSYSIGQVFMETIQNEEYTITQGVQQPYEISVITGIEETGISLNMTVYPNPTTDNLTLQIDENMQTDYTMSQLTYYLYDIKGNLLLKEIITGEQTQINMSGLASSTYFIKIISDKKSIKEFKIIKNQ